MKLSNIIFVSLLVGIHGKETPMARVVKLIAGLKEKVEADGKAEQASYDKYACWCEKTLERKASDISAAKELIEETEILIKKLKGEIASHGAEIAQLNKDIAANNAAQKDAQAMRDKEYGEYTEEKTESEQCIGALEAAVTVLTGAGTKKGFLDTSTHAAQLISVAAQVRTVLRRSSFPEAVSSKDLEVVKSYVSKPEDFMKAHSSAMSATQVGQNPFDDYAPQSTQIQGILKGMYDAFTSDLEKDNAAEAESQKSFEELMATKKEELATLTTTLQSQEADQASKIAKLKESQVLKDDTADQLAADETFFADTKDACKAKAKEWSIRTRLRTEELAGMGEAMKILSDGAKTFESATTTFLQVRSIKKHAAQPSKAYGKLSKLATELQSIKIAKIAALVQTGGHFDKVIGQIDDMIALLRKEEAEDIVHRDLCEASQNANKNEMADLAHKIKKADEMLERMGNTEKELEEEISALEGDIGTTNKNMKELLDMRNEESDDFKQALKDDTDAIGLLQKAITALSKYYKNNNIPVSLTQKAPEYAEDPDKAPETSFSNSGSRSSESGGILAILSMLVEDLEKEVADARGDDADAQAKYDEQNGALQKSLDAQTATKVGVEEELASLEEKIDAAETFKNGKSGDKDAEEETKKALATDCKWVETHFKSRRDKRKDEMQGLVDAKAFLAGIDAGDTI